MFLGKLKFVPPGLAPITEWHKAGDEPRSAADEVNANGAVAAYRFVEDADALAKTWLPDERRAEGEARTRTMSGHGRVRDRPNLRRKSELPCELPRRLLLPAP
jgi:hypothetical protein